MRDGLIWALVIVACVAAGWLWSEWRRRSADRSSEAGRPGRAGDRRRPGAGGDRPGSGPRGGRTSGGRSAGGRTSAPPRPRDAGRPDRDRPRPGEIWWADVPYADGTGSKVRPCLVLRVDGADAEVLKITSQDKSDRDDHVSIPTRSWDADAEHDSWLDVSEPIPVALTAFADKAGDCDAGVWRGVRRLPHLTA
ncbi:type II toxin-antitoxin system PemK/MazF family toxin [Micromonospora humi]|uniref:PemK-like, MazF-like toxin of type II toxin-antitoxin system n=1 Tax=Micromonospora humi TaxID=745366 RepID=A0A1C5IX61_9ACTN|nr:type II toxin-antitoxin system PemK/MazF family toxin [Micromonospora humi]SCG62376.1 PemK-like, MazF-like toxin of type II toxin-antitoxin system [Micromonospora humi]